jgi:hypothetical protein
MLPASRVGSAAVGPPVPASALGRELRQSLPPALIEALDRVSDQIAVEIFEPLLCAASLERAARTFEQVFPKFRDYYASTLLILWGFLQEDPQRFSALTIRSFEESENLLRASGPHWIGQDATLNALHAVATITRVAKAAIRVFDRKAASDIQAGASAREPWGNSIVGFVNGILHGSLNSDSTCQRTQDFRENGERRRPRALEPELRGARLPSHEDPRSADDDASHCPNRFERGRR